MNIYTNSFKQSKLDVYVRILFFVQAYVRFIQAYGYLFFIKRSDNILNLHTLYEYYDSNPKPFLRDQFLEIITLVGPLHACLFDYLDQNITK